MARKRRSSCFFPAVITIFGVLSVQLVHAGNTTCVSNQLSWYSDVVGESPCMTYQRLRQICNNDYQVPIFSTTVPGDQCDDQVSECCCSMVGFQLSMLCMVCQQDTGDSGGIGIDAPVKGTYTINRGACGPGVNHTLPSDLQSAICNENIRIDNFLYDSWEDGTWFYVWTKENVEKRHAEYNNNTFTHCPNQISPSPTPAATSSTVQLLTATPTISEVPSISTPDTATSGVKISASTANSTPSSSAPPQSSDANFGAGGQSQFKLHMHLMGGVVGGVLGLVAIALAGVVWRRNKTGGLEGLQVGTHDAHFEYRSTTLAPLFTEPADPLTLDRLLNTEQRPASRITYDGDPSVPVTSAPRTLATSSIAPTPVPETWQPEAPLTETQHQDGGPLSTGRTRSNSGLPPPAYEDSWDSDRSRHTLPSAGSVAALGPMPLGFRGSVVSERQTMDVVARSATYL